MAFESLSITGSLLGTSSWAISGSKILTGSTLQFPYTGSADIIGTLILNSQSVIPVENGYGLPNGNPTMSVPTDLPFTTFRTPGSSFTANAAAFILQGGKTYYLEAQLTQPFSMTSGTTFIFEWCTSNNNPITSSNATKGYIGPFESNTNSYSSSVATAVFTPLSPFVAVKLRITSGSAGAAGQIGWGGLITKVQRIA